MLFRGHHNLGTKKKKTSLCNKTNVLPLLPQLVLYHSPLPPLYYCFHALFEAGFDLLFYSSAKFKVEALDLIIVNHHLWLPWFSFILMYMAWNPVRIKGIVRGATQHDLAILKASYRTEIQQVVELLVCFHCSHSLLLFTWPFQSQQVTTSRDKDSVSISPLFVRCSTLLYPVGKILQGHMWQWCGCAMTPFYCVSTKLNKNKGNVRRFGSLLHSLKNYPLKVQDIKIT